LNSHQLHEECNIPFDTAKRYVDSSVADEYQRELNLKLKEMCPNTEVKKKCWEWGVEVDHPPQGNFDPLRDLMEGAEQTQRIWEKKFGLRRLPKFVT
jgi:hypothetical protein